MRTRLWKSLGDLLGCVLTTPPPVKGGTFHDAKVALQTTLQTLKGRH